MEEEGLDDLAAGRGDDLADGRVLARLARIDELAGRDGPGGGGPPGELLAELRSLLREAEELARGRTATDDGEGTEEVVERLRTALARDIIGM